MILLSLPDPFWMLRDPTWRAIGIGLGVIVLVVIGLVFVKIAAK